MRVQTRDGRGLQTSDERVLGLLSLATLVSLSLVMLSTDFQVEED